MSDTGWELARWWRIIDTNGRVWMESSDREEIMAEFTTLHASDFYVQRLYRRIQEEWKEVPSPVDPSSFQGSYVEPEVFYSHGQPYVKIRVQTEADIDRLEFGVAGEGWNPGAEHA